jgi:WD40 repeat protein
MFLAKTGIVFASLAALFCLAATGVVSTTLAADPQTSRLRKEAPDSAAKVREVGKLTSLPGAAVKLTFALDGKRLVVETEPPPPPRPPVLGSRVFIERSETPTIHHTVWNLSSHSVGHPKPMAYELGTSLLSPDLRTLAVRRTEWLPRGAGVRVHYEFYDLASQRKMARPKAWKWLESGMDPLAFSADSKVAAAKVVARHGVVLFDVETQKSMSEIRMDDDKWLGGLPGVVFSGDGKTLAVPLLDRNELAICSVESGKVLTKFDKFENGSVLALRADGKVLAVGNPRSEKVVLWDVATGKELAAWDGHKPGANDLAFSADGKVLFAAGDKIVLAWDVAGKREIARLRGHQAAVRVLAVSPDGKRLASGGADKSVHLWDISAFASESKSRLQTPDNQKP